MVEMLLFHHAQGLTDGIRAFADEVRSAGHVVHTPDLYDGRTFVALGDGVAHAAEIGFDELTARGLRAAGELGEGLVYAGFSLGVLPAQRLAQTRSGARGALLLESFVPPTEFGTSWPAGVPVQVHGMDADPYFADEGDLAAARDFVAATPQAELFEYRGDRHLFADSSLTSFEPEAAELLRSRVLAFLAALG
jgi:dienelactone hydrolase